MRIPVFGKAGVIALAISGLALSGCATNDYGRSYGSVSVGSGWYDSYPGYYGYDHRYWGHPGYYYSPRSKHHHRRWKGRDGGHWQGSPSRSERHWRGRDSRPDHDRWQGRSRHSDVRNARPSRSDSERIERWQSRRGQVGDGSRPQNRRQHRDRK